MLWWFIRSQEREENSMQRLQITANEIRFIFLFFYGKPVTVMPV
jgi:hypothetical protein